MPDFFEPGEPWPQDKFPPQTDEEKAKLQEFFGGLANPAGAVAKLINVGKTLKGEGVEFVGVYGFCWGALRSGELSVDQVLIERLAGGKVTILAGSSDETPFGAAAAVHPA